jgi:ATP-dependent RNA helicase HelY
VTSPAERYAAARERARTPDLADFEASLPFPLDPFQREGCEAVALGHSVLVAAPTGAGKTVVGEFAVAHAHRRGLKAFYTTPIKALSNQKFSDLRAAYGPEAVGLLTGDTSINPHAEIVVMTTEVLRNMIYAGSRDLDQLAALSGKR